MILTFNAYKSCFVQLRDFRCVRRFFTYGASKLVASALVSSQLDYCNSLFRSLSKFNLRKLQCFQNSAAKLLTNINRYTSITPVLKRLYWLSVDTVHCLTQPHLYAHVCSISVFLLQFLQYQVQSVSCKVLPFYL